VRDLQTGRTAKIAPSGGLTNVTSYAGGISADGRVVAIVSDASNLVPDDTNGLSDVFTTTDPHVLCRHQPSLRKAA